MSNQPMRAISLRDKVFEVIESVRNEITAQRQKVDRHARPATFSEAVWQVLKESGRVVVK